MTTLSRFGDLHRHGYSKKKNNCLKRVIKGTQPSPYPHLVYQSILPLQHHTFFLLWSGDDWRTWTKTELFWGICLQLIMSFFVVRTVNTQQLTLKYVIVIILLCIFTGQDTLNQRTNVHSVTSTVQEIWSSQPLAFARLHFYKYLLLSTSVLMLVRIVNTIKREEIDCAHKSCNKLGVNTESTETQI